MRPAEVVRRSADYLARHGVDSPTDTAEVLLMHFLDTDRAGLYARSEGLDARTARLLGRALCQRCSGTPLQYLTGEQQFLDLVLGVAPGVFVPRPETEGLALAALKVLANRPSPVVVDVGTGTGALALAVKQRRPDATVVATDVSLEAVKAARANAVRHGLDVDVRRGDLLSPVPEGLRGNVDVIVSNPPYVRREDYEALPEEVRREPYDALVGGTDVHRRLAVESSHWLAPGGWLAMEVGEDQGEEIRRLLQPMFSEVEVIPDLAGRDRVVMGCRPASG
jgi:release factor glutamine methyltransferase